MAVTFVSNGQRAASRHAAQQTREGGWRGVYRAGEGLFEAPDEPVEDGRYWCIAIARDGAVEAATDDGGDRP